MPALGEVDYTLVRPLMSGQQRLMNQEQIRTSQDTRREAMRQRAIAERNYQQGQVMLRDIKASALRNKKPDGTIDYERFIGDLYSINPELATKVQGAYTRQVGTEGKPQGWQARNDDWARVQAGEMEEIDFFKKWAPSVGYGASQEAVEQAARKSGASAAASTGARIQTEARLADVSAETSGTIAGGKAKGEREAGLTLTATNAERIGDFAASFAQLDVLTKSFSNPDAPQGPLAQLRKANPYDWEAQAKQQLVASTKQLVGKALEGGVLRAEDEVKYEKILPKIGDTYKTAVQKSKNLQTMLNNTYVARLDALRSARYDISNFQQSLLTKSEKPANLTDAEWEELQRLESKYGK